MNQHIIALQYKYDSIEKQIANENKKPLPDYIALQHLKKQKLFLKETMHLHLA